MAGYSILGFYPLEILHFSQVHMVMSGLHTGPH